MGGLNAAQQTAFSNAANRWAQVVVGDFPAVTVEGEVINALVIEASGKNIDGEGNILGQSSPTFLLPNAPNAAGTPAHQRKKRSRNRVSPFHLNSQL